MWRRWSRASRQCGRFFRRRRSFFRLGRLFFLRCPFRFRRLFSFRRRFFLDLFATALAFAIGLGDFSGVGDETVAYWLFSSLLTWARRRLPAIAPSATAVASQRRKQTTATERNRARDAINPEASTVIC